MKSADDIYREALTKYGINSQILMVMEKMAELQKELCKNRRGAENIVCIAEEIADVEIMLEQMKLYFDIGEHVEKIKNIKLRRLQDRLEETK